MFSSNYDPITMRPPAPRDNYHQHSLSANMVPSYANRNMPPYYMNENLMPHGNNFSHHHNNTSPSAPRYSPNLRPWRRQHSHSSLSFMTSPRPEQSEYTTSQQPRRPADRTPVCVSPFRSVRRMKQPFQLMLPASPACESTATFAKEPRRLHPSPSLSDSRESHPSSSSTYFSPKPESEAENEPEFNITCDCAPGGKICDNCNVQQSPQVQNEEQKRTGEITNVHMAHSTLIKQYEDANANSNSNDREATPSSAETESTTPSPNCGETGEEETLGRLQRARAGTTSTQASWVPDNFSYCQSWLQGVETMDVKDEKSRELSRRKFQIVQVSPPPSKHDVKDVVSSVFPLCETNGNRLMPDSEVGCCQ